MRTPWWTSYFSLRPRRIETVSSMLGSVTLRLEATLQSGIFFNVLLVFFVVVAPIDA